MNPQRKYQEDIEPDIRPNLGVIEGGGESSEPKREHLASVPDDTGNSAALAANDLNALEGGGESSEPKRGHLRSVGSDETNALPNDDTVGQGYSKEGKRKGIKFRGGFWNKKRAGIAGGLLGIGVGGSLIIGTISLGPLELITASRALQHSFSRSESDSSSRLSMLFKYARFAKTGDIGETRVSIVGSKVFGSAIKSLNDAGVEFDRSKITGRSVQLNIDQEKLSKSVPELQGEALGSEGAKSILAEKLGVPIDDIASGSGGKFSVKLQDYNIKSLRLLNKSALKLLGDGKIVTAVRARALNKFMDLPNLLHPFSKARSAAENKLAQSITKDKENKGENPQQAQSEAEQEAITQENAQAAADTTTGPTAEAAKTDLEAIDNANSGIASTLTKGLTLTGFACIARNTAGEIAKANRDLVELPAAAAAMRVVAAGEQGEIGNDKTLKQAGAMVKSFSDGNGKTIFDGKAFEYLRNPTSKPTGVDIPNNYHATFSGKSTAQSIRDGANSIINDTLPFLSADAACSPAGLLTQAVVAVGISVVSEVASGGIDSPAVAAIWTAKFVASNAISIVGVTAMLDLIKHAAIDNKLPQKVFEGPVGGDLLAFGSRFAANTASVAAGGVALLGSDSTTLPNNSASVYAYNQTSQESAYQRTLSLKNPDSLVSNLAMDYYSSNLSGGLSGIADSFMHIGSFINHTFASFLPHAAAATDVSYDWGFPQYGIPDDMLNDPTMTDPYENADTVAKMLDTSDGQNYISKASTCFGATIQKGSDGTWDVSPGSIVDTGSTDYTSADCTENSTTGNVNAEMWRKTIMFIFDTRTMNAAACYNNDADACTSEGIGTSAAATQGTGTYKDPLRDIKHIVPERIDGGVDYNGDDGPVYAVGDGVVVAVRTFNSGWPGLGSDNNGAYILYKLTGDGPAKDKYVYMAEDCTPTVHPPQTVTADTKICDYHYQGTAMEMGWSDGSYTYVTSDYLSHGGGSYASNSGQDFSKFLVSLHAPPGKVEGSKSTVPMPAGWPTW